MISKKLQILVIPFLVASMLLSITGRAGAQTTVSVSPSSDARTGLPGSVVSYSIALTNNGTLGVSVDVSATMVGSWTTTIDPASLTLAASETKTVTIYVHIPDTALTGQNDVTLVRFKDNLTDEVMGETQLTTTANIPEPTSAASGRPVVVVNGYDTGSVKAGKEFTLALELKNTGQYAANNILVSFDSTDFMPTATGGVKSVGSLDNGDKTTITQNFLVSDALAWQSAASLKVNISYEDSKGTPFTGGFTLTIGISAPSSTGSYATATPSVVKRPQLVVTNYKTDVDPLQPGSIFTMDMELRNLGNMDAGTITMVVGGGGTQGGDSGTPSAGGMSGASGDLTNFAPLGSSNLVYLGDLKQGETKSIPLKLIVNVNTTPGAYTLKLSFVYNDAKGNRLVDDQVITLLVYSLPQVEINYYRDPGIFYANSMSVLPLQVTNLGKKSYVLGNMKVTAENADVSNNVSLVGALDPGGYYTLDVNLMPFQEGTLNVEVSINYTDDFNQPRFITQTLQMEVMPAMDMGPESTLTPGEEGSPVIDGVIPQPENFMQKVWRFIKGLFGLDSGVDESTMPGTEMPTESAPIIKGPKG